MYQGTQTGITLDSIPLLQPSPDNMASETFICTLLCACYHSATQILTTFNLGRGNSLLNTLDSAPSCRLLKSPELQIWMPSPSDGFPVAQRETSGLQGVCDLGPILLLGPFQEQLQTETIRKRLTYWAASKFKYRQKPQLNRRSMTK